MPKVVDDSLVTVGQTNGREKMGGQMGDGWMNENNNKDVNE